jgi:hypothetical protein
VRATPCASSNSPRSPSTSSRDEPTCRDRRIPNERWPGTWASKLIPHGRCRPRSASPRFAVIVTSTTGGHPRLGEGTCVLPLPTCCSLATTIDEKPHAHRPHHRRPSRNDFSPSVPRPRRTSRRSCGSGARCPGRRDRPACGLGRRRTSPGSPAGRLPCVPRRGPDGGAEAALSVGDTDDPLARLAQHLSRLAERDCAMAIQVDPHGPRPVQHGERPGNGRQCGRAHG